MLSHDIHVHTIISECCHEPDATPENYIRLAKDLGLKVIGFSDHLWDSAVDGASKWYSTQNFDHIMQIKDMIPVDTQGIKVLIGCETEYCGNGKIGISPKVAKQLDFVLVPISHVHMKGFVLPSWMNTPEDIANTMVKYFKDVTNFDFITGIAHPFYPLGHENIDGIISCIPDDVFMECFSMAAEKGISIEINACHFPSIKGVETETYNDETFLNMFLIAKAAGCKFHLGSDAHSIDVLPRIIKLQKIVEDLGFTDEDIHPIVTDNAIKNS